MVNAETGLGGIRRGLACTKSRGLIHVAVLRSAGVLREYGTRLVSIEKGGREASGLGEPQLQSWQSLQYHSQMHAWDA